MNAAVLDRRAETAVVEHTITVLDRPTEARRWRRDRPDEIAAARALFTELVGRGYFAYTEGHGPGGGTVIREFEPEADITIMPVMVGG